MSKGAQTKLVQSKTLFHPSFYVKAMYNQYRSWVFDEEDCLPFKGEWRKRVFQALESKNLDVEIGPGSGGFFEHMAVNNKDRFFIAVELKYKPLIQTTRRIKNSTCINAKTIRYNARMLKDIFASGELNNIYIHFPDPWPKKRHHKHRLIKPDFVKTLHDLQRKDSFVEIKTDHKAYAREIKLFFEDSPYKKLEYYDDLHKQKDLNKDHFSTHFEKIFIRKKEAIRYLRYRK